MRTSVVQTRPLRPFDQTAMAQAASGDRPRRSSSLSRSGSFNRSSSFKLEDGGGGPNDIDVDAHNQTLVRLFLSGKTTAVLAPARASITQGDNSLDVPNGEVEYFPDPPCIAPYEEDEHNQFTYGDNAPTPQRYWKDHVTWKRDDPEIGAWINLVDRFRSQWDTKTAMYDSESVSPGMRRSLVKTEVNNVGEATLIQAFVNITRSSVGIRSDKSYDASRSGQTLGPGEPTVIEQVVDKDGARFLKLADERGWVFDSKDDLEVMAKMEDLEVGTAWYRVVCNELIDVRRAPVYDDSHKTGRLLCPDEVVAANMRCRVRGSHFAHLADGRGWVFVLKQGAHRRNPSKQDVVLKECGQEFDKDASLDVMNALPPTTEVVEVGQWTYVVGKEPVLAIGTRPHGTYISPGDVVLVNMSAFARGDPPRTPADTATKWLRLLDGRGWVPEKGTRGNALMTLREDNSSTHPPHYKGRQKDIDKARQPWMVGTA